MTLPRTLHRPYIAPRHLSAVNPGIHEQGTLSADDRELVERLQRYLNAQGYECDADTKQQQDVLAWMRGIVRRFAIALSIFLVAYFAWQFLGRPM